MIIIDKATIFDWHHKKNKIKTYLGTTRKIPVEKSEQGLLLNQTGEDDNDDKKQSNV